MDIYVFREENHISSFAFAPLIPLSLYPSFLSWSFTNNAYKIILMLQYDVCIQMTVLKVK